jgi:hypothetical protein
MKAYRYLFVVLVLSTVAVNSGFAAQGQAPKSGGGSVSGTVGGQGPRGDKGSSSINGTGMGAQH